MVCKCIGKLIVLTTELLIHILLKVQANDFAHVSFRPLSPSIMHHYFARLDKIQTIGHVCTSFGPSPLSRSKNGSKFKGGKCNFPLFSLIHKDVTNSLHILLAQIFLHSNRAFPKAMKCQSFLRRMMTPCSGKITNLNAGEWRYAGDSDKQNLDRMSDKITFSSVMAKCWPTQM
jgi:hypothetical protein